MVSYMYFSHQRVYLGMRSCRQFCVWMFCFSCHGTARIRLYILTVLIFLALFMLAVPTKFYWTYLVRCCKFHAGKQPFLLSYGKWLVLCAPFFFDFAFTGSSKLFTSWNLFINWTPANRDICHEPLIVLWHQFPANRWFATPSMFDT